MNVLFALRSHFSPVLASLLPDSAKLADFLAMIKLSQNPKHGDYQVNFVMPLAKLRGQAPKDLAAQIAAQVPTEPLLEAIEVAGPGFLNLRLRADWLAEQARRMALHPCLGVEPTTPARTFVVDFSSPNVAKPLHVGHLRSTIIGDALARILAFLGHRVIRDNHLGDWGTQFGMILYGYKHFLNAEAYRSDPVRELARLYLEVRQRTKGDEDDEGNIVRTAEEAAILKACQQETAKLHAGDAENVRLWREFMPHCLAEVHAIYQRLGVRFDYEYGESFYNPMLPAVIDDLLAKGVARASQGALIVQDGKQVALVRKSDGAYTYMTTDLATIRYRVETWNPDAILYAVDFRQAAHFRTLFAVARQWGYTNVELTHISFGSVLGDDRKPLSTRGGTSLELQALLDEAVRRAAHKYEQSRAERLAAGYQVPEITAEEKARIAEVVGIGAVKYADLMQNRNSDYVFNWDKMLATVGNTATYMQYTYARCRSILAEAGVVAPTSAATAASSSANATAHELPPLLLTTAAERNLTLNLLRFHEVVESATVEYLPHYLTDYLWELAKSFSSFYEQCPVLKAETPPQKHSRLLLTELTARVIRQTLELLGIGVVERM